MNNMLTREEVKNFLEIDQPQLEEFLKKGKLHAYKIGGTYLRFRKEEILNLRSELQPKKIKHPPDSFLSRAADFWRFNNFYIVALLLVLAVVIVILRT